MLCLPFPTKILNYGIHYKLASQDNLKINLLEFLDRIELNNQSAII